MTILMLLEHHYPPDIRVEKEIDSLLNEGYSVVLACSTRSGINETVKEGRLTIVRKKISGFFYKSSVGCLKFPFYFYFWKYFINQLFADYKIDIIHVHDLPLASSAVSVRERYNIPFILDSHENYPYMLESATHTQTILGKMLSSTKQWLKYEQQMLQEADIVLSIIEEQRDRFLESGVDKEKVYIVSNTPKAVTIDIDERTHSEFVYVYAGNIYATKGMDIMIRAFRSVRTIKNDVQLWIIGDIKKWNKATGLIDNTNNTGIKCWGWQALEDLYKLVAKADVALLPHVKNNNSDYGIPNKLFQYMMAGKPVISSNCNPIKRILKETQAGLTYQFDSSDELAEKMLYLYDNRQEAKMMGFRGKEAVKTKYNWQKEETNLLAAYKKLSQLSALS